MRKAFQVTCVIMAMLIFTGGCSSNADSGSETSADTKKVELVISAAASLQDAMSEIQDTYMEEHPEVTLRFNYGGSGSLQQQISKGAPADLFFSAAEDKFNRLVEEGKIDKSDSTDLLGNALVLIVPEKKSTIHDFSELATENEKNIALGTPESVPAGKYGKESLKNMGLWKKIKPDVVYAKDVRQVLSYVETGNVDAGLVYKTDAVLTDRVKAVQTADRDTHSSIVYPVGVVKDSKHYDAAKEFYMYLQSDEALKVFEDYGFHVE